MSVNRHDRYTPDLRDKIARALGAFLAPGYHVVLTAPLLRELADTVSKSSPVLSLYIQLMPERKVGGSWRTYLSCLSEAVLRPVHDKEARHALEQEVAQVSQAVEEELPVLGRGAAFFSCRTAGLWPETEQASIRACQGSDHQKEVRHGPEERLERAPAFCS